MENKDNGKKAPLYNLKSFTETLKNSYMKDAEKYMWGKVADDSKKPESKESEESTYMDNIKVNGVTWKSKPIPKDNYTGLGTSENPVPLKKDSCKGLYEQMKSAGNAKFYSYDPMDIYDYYDSKATVKAIEDPLKEPTEEEKIASKREKNISDMLRAGFIEWASFNGERLFHTGVRLYNSDIQRIYDVNDHEATMRLAHVSSTCYKNSAYDISLDKYGIPTINLKEDMKTKEKAAPKKAKAKTKFIEVEINTETNEVVSGKEELEYYNLLNPVNYNLNSKEEAIMNTIELIEFYALEECNRTKVKFDIEKDADYYKKMIEKHTQILSQFKVN